MKNELKMLHTTLCRKDVGKYVFLPGSPQRVDRIAQYLENSFFIAENREHRTYGGYLEGQLTLVTSTGMGGPSTCIALEELVKLGAKTFIRIGTCSSTNTRIKRGDVIIPTAAVRMDGTSLHYAPIEYPAVPNFELHKYLLKSATSHQYPYHADVIITRDSFYTQNEAHLKPIGYELINKWNSYKAMGAIATEMECAPLFIAAASLNVGAAGVLICATDYNKYSEEENIYPISFEPRAIEVAIEAMRIKIRNDVNIERKQFKDGSKK